MAGRKRPNKRGASSSGSHVKQARGVTYVTEEALLVNDQEAMAAKQKQVFYASLHGNAPNTHTSAPPCTRTSPIELQPRRPGKASVAKEDDDEDDPMINFQTSNDDESPLDDNELIALVRKARSGRRKATKWLAAMHL